MQKVRWGILSTAHINRRVIPPIHESSQGMLTAIASRDLDKARMYAKQWQIPQAFGSYEEMLQSGEIDAVYISLPNHLHAEWTIQALQAGVHVLCEKPFAITEEQVGAMIDASHQTGKHLAEAFMYRHHPQTRLVRQYIDEGKLGEVTLIQGSFSFFMNNREGNIRMSPTSGGGALWDIGIYPVSFAQFIYGRPPKLVTAVQRTGETGVDETLVGQMEYGKGQIAQINCSFEIPFHTSMIIHGTQGRIELTRPFSNIKDGQFLYTPVDGETQKVDFQPFDPYLGEIADMNHAIQSGAPNLIHLDESRNHVRTALALYQAAQSGQIVPLR